MPSPFLFAGAHRRCGKRRVSRERPELILHRDGHDAKNAGFTS